MDIDMSSAVTLTTKTMDDAVVAELFGCRNCARLVCEMCALVEGGSRQEPMERECLSCRIERGRGAGRVRWVGGIGWMP